MNSRRLAYSALFALIGVFILQIIIYYPLLPLRVASHFDFQGNAIGWTSKSNFITTMAFVIALIVGVFLAIPVLLAKLPESINLPNKTYWLAPERKETTILVLGNYIIWMGTLTTLLLVMVLNIICNANINHSAQLGMSVMIMLAVYMVILFTFITFMIRRFVRIEQQ